MDILFLWLIVLILPYHTICNTYIWWGHVILKYYYTKIKLDI